MDLDAALREHFGFSGFRAGQRDACEAAVAGRDALVVMPTGSGKSLCYQLPALVRDDLTIVVSPLVSLMQDQVEALAARGYGNRVALINSQQQAGANESALACAAAGELRLLYVAPERFSSPRFVAGIREAEVGLFVVDEAHCVSQWGHDFRPDYFRLADAARHLGARSLLASTATATPRVLSEPDALPAIVYAGTRAGAEELAQELGEALGEEALPYHAGLERERRAAVQRRFLADEVRVVVATNAFGMGVDKPNVRTVVHASVPASLEAYYQEAGRAGRDGLLSRALLLAENRDKALHVHFIRRDELDERLPGRLAGLLADAAVDLEGRYGAIAEELARELRVSGDSLRALLGHLARAGVIEPSPSPPDRVAGRLVRPFDRRAAAHCHALAAEGTRARWRQYREIWGYVETGSCRRRAILRHFGDRAQPTAEGACCDACDAGLVPSAPAPDPRELGDLDDAILSVARAAKPAVGRTTCAEILHGARTKKIERNSYDGLPAYATSARRRRADILARIDELIEEGRLATSGGAYPVLKAPLVRAG
jgi:ATP-dependent DNA helicase RecQ